MYIVFHQLSFVFSRRYDNNKTLSELRKSLSDQENCTGGLCFFPHHPWNFYIWKQSCLYCYA